MCCKVLGYGLSNMTDWTTAGFFILASGLMVYLYFYTIAVCIEQIKCSFTGKKPTLSNAPDWCNKERLPAFFFGIFGLSLCLILPSALLSTKIACGMMIITFTFGFLGTMEILSYED